MSSDIQSSAPITQLTMSKAGDPVPTGQYRARFIRCETSEGNPAYPPAYRWSWEIIDGELSGREISCLTSQKVNSMSNAGKLIVSLNGGPLEAEETVDLQSFTEAAYLCSVVEAGNGTKVDSVFKI